MKDPRPLAGGRVLDLTWVLGGPFAAMQLGDLGAEVIKIEPPEGDYARTVPPHFLHGDSLFYVSINRNKLSLVLDLKRRDGLRVLRPHLRLLAGGDAPAQDRLSSPPPSEPAPDRGQPDRLRQQGAVARQARLRFRRPGHGRRDEPDGRGGRPAGAGGLSRGGPNRRALPRDGDPGGADRARADGPRPAPGGLAPRLPGGLPDDARPELPSVRRGPRPEGEPQPARPARRGLPHF
ncbi:MAG: CoA transferase [Candidatus Rokubacteria bacterium]|nr:CoA transferase [Candidatus Rokubacteria bacterium]